MKRFIVLLILVWNNFRKFLSRTVKEINKKYEKFKDKMERNIRRNDTEEYKDLAPVDEIKNGKEYFKALDWALKNEKVTNIALAGPYGSGKSSIIRSYEKMHPSMKSINISLASFLETKIDQQGTKIEKLVHFKEEKIEEGILKQLFYKVDYKKIPQSRYRKLHNVSRIRIFRNLVFLGILAIILSLFFLPDKFEKLKSFILKSGENQGLSPTMSVVLTVILVLLVFSIATYIFWWISTKYKFKELKLIDKASITVDKEEDKSIFNKNMDEIVYFFEATDFDTVFIEDLDRFKSAEIFIKLRELNTILNNYEMIKRRIVFIYAIKDDMFADKDRTKFFDFIVPVIPIINSTNSGEALLERLKGGIDDNGNDIFKHGITPGYITSVSPYIEDMRVLINIYNEFLVFKKTLRTQQDLKLFDEPMMSLMIFKNLYPKDFADLQLEEGVVKEAFLNKKDFITKKSKELNNEKIIKIKVLESIEKDILSNVKEIKAVMLFYLAKENGFVKYINVNGHNHYFSSIMQDSFDLTLLQNDRLTIYYINEYGSQERTINNINDLNEESGNKIGYIERCLYLKESIPNRKEELQQQIEKINAQIHKLSSMPFKDILEINSITDVLCENVRSNKLLVYMLRNGYIDEKYVNYMNYFRPNSITKEDMNFILSVRNHEPESYNYPLTKCEQVFERMLEHEFEQKEIYNFDLLEYLLKYKYNSTACNLFIKQLADEDNSSWNFINEFIDITENQDKFVELLGEQWEKMWSYIYACSNLTPSRKLFYFNLIIKNVHIEDIVRSNCPYDPEDYYADYPVFTQYFIENEDILVNLSNVNNGKIMEVIEKLEIIFSKLNTDNVSEEILDFIFNNKYYEINNEIINCIVKLKNPEMVNSLIEKNYTTLREFGYEPLLEYIHDNFIKYVEKIVIGDLSNTEESIDSVIIILNKIIQNQELCIKLIKKENVVLGDFSQCCLDLIGKHKEKVEWVWKAFMDYRKVVPIWKNVVTYWEHYRLTESLINFIRVNINALMEAEDKEYVNDNFIKNFLTEDIDISIYKMFAQKFKLIHFDITFSDLSEEQIRALLWCKYFDITPKRYLEMKEIYPDLYLEFILTYKESFLENIEEYSLEIEETEGLVISAELTETEKVCVLNASNINSMTEKIAYAIRDMKIVLDKNIVNIAWGVLPYDMRYQLFLNQITNYSLDEISDVFAKFDGPYKQLADRTRRHNVWLLDTDYNRSLVEYLVEESYITSFHYENKIIEEPITFNKREEKYIVCIIKLKK